MSYIYILQCTPFTISTLVGWTPVLLSSLLSLSAVQSTDHTPRNIQIVNESDLL